MEPQLEGCGKLDVEGVSYRQCLLQWSRNLRVAERVDRQGDAGRRRRASMEPQLEGCGKGTAGRVGAGQGAVASMEPQLEGCGKPRLFADGAGV